MSWQPIETAPRDGTRVLLWHPRALARGENVIVGWWLIDDWWTSHNCWLNDRDPDSDFDLAPTHWQPLPSPPTGPDQRPGIGQDREQG
jgi:hypothetical protein